MARTKPNSQDAATKTEDEVSEPTAEKSVSPRKVRDIPGGFPYLTSTGTLKKILEKIIEAQRPEKLNSDFVENVFKMKGGAARSCISILKRMGFITGDGTPTDLYAKFKTDSGRSSAALKGLQNAFAEIFRKSEFAYAADDAKIRDIIIEITGMQRNDGVFHAIKGTFNVIKGFVRVDELSAGSAEEVPAASPSGVEHPPSAGPTITGRTFELGLKYNINTVLPETSDLTVLNAIFRSLKENLLE